MREIILMRAMSSVLLLAFTAGSLAAQTVRTRYTINDGWRYSPTAVEFAERPLLSDDDWQRVSLPHTWNAHDPFDDVPSYHRGISWYRKTLLLPEELKDKRIFLYFEGVNQAADVYVNGAFIGRHLGGYTAFTFDVTKAVRFGEKTQNLIAVKVDNSHDPQVPPLSVGFALYGGIYRDVWLLAVDPLHVKLTDHASSGVYITTPRVSRDMGQAHVRGTVVNSTSEPKRIRISHSLVDSSGARVAESSSVLNIAAGAEASFAQIMPAVAQPQLWSPDRPYLYRLRTSVQEGDVLRDEVENPVGFRWFSFDAGRGFFLNGERLQLRGTNRHQDMQGFGSALSNQQHVQDLRWIKQMGANFLRLAHYPQDPAVLDAADRLGLLIWEEIPVVNYITVSEEFAQNARTALREMIRQHFNHPSVILWGTMNEVFLWSQQGARIGRHTDTTYMAAVRSFAADLDRLARAEDPARYSAMAIHGSADYDAAGVADMAQVLGLNLYSGWYGGEFEDFGKSLDRRHARYPKQILMISEYGAGSDLRLNALVPERFDHSSTWFRMFHESYLRQIKARPYIAGSAIWNQFDFSQPHIGESMPNMNQKGMLTFDRKPKDAFYLYQANWNPAPLVYIASRDWTHRTGTAPARAVLQPVDVYSNVGPVELFANGKSLGRREPDDLNKLSWQVPFTDGSNLIEARAVRGDQVYSDQLVIQFDYYPQNLRDPSAPFTQLGVNVGSNAQFAAHGAVWEADQLYRPGAFGYLGGERKLMARDVVMTNTPHSGLYVTYRLGLEGYRFDVPDGSYTVELSFAEPERIAAGARVFDVLINGATVLTGIDLVAQTGIGAARSVVIDTAARSGGGIQVTFRARSGQPLLNGIRVTRR